MSPNRCWAPVRDGASAGTAHPRARPGGREVVDMRHPSTRSGDRGRCVHRAEATGQRYAGGEDRVKPAMMTCRPGLWMTPCRACRRLVRLRAIPVRTGSARITPPPPVVRRLTPSIRRRLTVGSQSVENSVEHRAIAHRGRVGGPVRRGGSRGRPGDRSRNGLARDRPRPPAQPARLAARQRAGDPAREHGDHRRPQRLHPQPARGPAAGTARGLAERRPRSRDPAGGHRQPRPGGPGRSRPAPRRTGPRSSRHVDKAT